MNYQEEKKRRREKYRSLKKKLNKIINSIVCKILRKYSKKCENCAILNGCDKKYFLDTWLYDDFEYLIYCNCEHYNIMKYYLELKKLFKRKIKND